jgi:putative flippase GtrA
MQELIKKHADKLRFAIVGGLNTAIDFVVLFVLVALGLPTIASNVLSTSTALVFSFFANKTFTFKDNNKGTKKQFAIFLIITLFGLWILQPIVIEGTRLTIETWFNNSYIVLFIGKVLATCVTLVWNYLMYKKFVFKKQPDDAHSN